MTNTSLMSIDERAADERAGGPAREPAVTRLTDGQESLYILTRLAGEQPVYNMPFAFRLRGPLDLGAFQSAVRAVGARHHALRTTIVETDQGLRQQTHPELGAPFETHVLGREAGVDEEKRLREELARAAGRPFDLEREPAWRTDLFKISAEEHAALFTLHHTFGDLESIRILFRDFELAYGAAAEGREPGFPEIGLQMDGYAAREAGEEPTPETLAYWRRELAGLPDLEMPGDAPRPRLPRFRGAAHRVTFPAALAEGVRGLARASKCSPYMVFLAALQALVLRRTGQGRFALATPFSRRQEPELENTVGYLVNLLPIPCAPNPRGSFRDLLRETRGKMLEVFGHAGISMRRILQESKVAADSPRNALSRIVFQYAPEGPAELNLPGLETLREEIHTGTAKFELSISLAETAQGIEAEFEHDTDIFSAETIGRLARHFQSLAESAVRDPDAEIARLDYLTADDRELLARVNETKAPYPRDSSVVDLFEEQAARGPERVALSCGGQTVTYAELNRRADQVARFLMGKGVRTGDFVGVCLERSLALPAALLGIMKAGAAFVPFDAKYPEARLKYMFADAGVKILLTSADLRGIAPPEVEPALIEEAGWGQDGGGDPGGLPKVGPEAVAYMMYTSGSTGNPKGVTVPHRAVVRLVKGNDFAKFGPDEVFLLFAPVSFDASTLELWGPLLNGGRLAIYPPNFESLDQFAEVVAREKVTTLWLSSGLFNMVADKKMEALGGVRQLLVGGDVVSPEHTRRVYAANPAVTLINGYGPTENTTFTCCYTIPRDFPAGRPLPIGRPIRNTEAHILDEHLQPTPVGAPGELHCGGDGLSDGYWRNPELTARVFVANPFRPGERLYKTGDKARWLPDGNIEFLGRLDSQTKIRGFRIELGEIESALRRLPGVRDVAAVTDGEGAEKRLLAFVTAQPGVTLAPAAMHGALQGLLPDHARPSLIRVVEELPLGANGKVDKNALLAMGAGPEEPAAGAGSPAILTEAEAAIERVWREVLGVSAIGLDDNFFHCGGDSLRAIQSALQINRALGTNLTVSNIFEAPTIRALAGRSGERKTGAAPKIGRAQGDRIEADEVANLSDSEVDALLSEMLARNG